jgi:acetyl-CoA carboxylase biotin carboxylase subunit
MIDGMGDKASAKETMKKAGVPTIPGSKGIIKDFNNCKKIALEIG